MYNITDLIQEKLIEAGFKNVTYGLEGEFNLDDHNLLPMAHGTLTTSSLSNYNQVSFVIFLGDILSRTDLLDTEEMVNPYKQVSNLIDIQHDLNIRGLKFINLIANAQTKFYQRLDNNPILNWNDDFAKDHLVGYDLELVFNLENPDLCS